MNDLAHTIPLIYEDMTIQILSPNLHTPRGTAFVFIHKPTRSVFVTDFGIGFGHLGKTSQMHEQVDAYAEFLRPYASAEHPLEVMLTHGHCDHLCGTARLATKLPLRVSMSPFTAYILSLSNPNNVQFDRRMLEQSGRFQVGAFTINYGPAVHSLPQTRFAVIECPRADVPNKTMRILFMSEFRIADPEIARGLSKQMLDMVAAYSPYDLVFLDGLRKGQEGFTPAEDVVREPMARIMESIPGDLMVPYLSSKLAVTSALAQEVNALGHGFDARGGSMKRLKDYATEQGWVPKVRFNPADRNSRVVFAVTGSQNEPGSYLNRLAEGKVAESLPNDSIFVAQGAIPMYVEQIRGMYEEIAKRIPDGKIILSRSEHRRLGLKVPNTLFVEDLIQKRFETTSGHGKNADQDLMAQTAATHGKAGEVFYYQHEGSENAAEETGVVEVTEQQNISQTTDLREAAHQWLSTHQHPH